MTQDHQQLREQVRAIWQAGVEAVQPERCLGEAFAGCWGTGSALPALSSFERILVVGTGKAGAAMSRALEQLFRANAIDLGRVRGVVNVPDETVEPLRAIRLHAARPLGTNHPTEAGVEGTRAILQLVAEAGPDDLLTCLISGGGSALLPAPVPGVALADKQLVTKLLHACGATIQEMNAVRKHLSLVKGGGLARQFRGRLVVSYIISDVIGDPLDVIASGPTCVDPTTFHDALKVLTKYELLSQAPAAVCQYLQRGVAGQEPETLKEEPRGPAGEKRIFNNVVANSRMALNAAQRAAAELGFAVVMLGDHIDGETRPVAEVLAAIARGSFARPGSPICILSGGETTVKLGAHPGKGGRNQEFVLAFLHKLGRTGMAGITVLSGGTDGEDGPTDAAGAMGDATLLGRAEELGFSAADFLDRHDAYHFFEPLGGLLRTGPTNTNVMDLRVILVSP